MIQLWPFFGGKPPKKKWLRRPTRMAVVYTTAFTSPSRPGSGGSWFCPHVAEVLGQQAALFEQLQQMDGCLRPMRNRSASNALPEATNKKLDFGMILAPKNLQTSVTVAPVAPRKMITCLPVVGVATSRHSTCEGCYLDHKSSTSKPSAFSHSQSHARKRTKSSVARQALGENWSTLPPMFNQNWQV